jgi:UPF0716 family protein affecting phage T7 exclusion
VEGTLLRLGQRRTIWAPGRRPGVAFLTIVVALVGAAVVLGRLPGLVLGLIALLLVIDRMVGFTPWGVAESDRQFARLRGERRRAAVRRRLLGPRAESDRLDYLDEGSGWASTAQRRRRGIESIPIDSIRGTVERDKAEAFDGEWRPPGWSRGRWTLMCLAAQRGTALPPISVYRVDGTHFVRDGHHRVSVLRALGTLEVDAEVTELRRR